VCRCPIPGGRGGAVWCRKSCVAPAETLSTMDTVPYTPGVRSQKPDAQVHPESEVGVLRFLASSPQQVERIAMLARTFCLMGSPRRCSSELVGSTRKSSITSVNTHGDSQAKNRTQHCFRWYVTKPIAGVRKGSTFVRTRLPSVEKSIPKLFPVKPVDFPVTADI